VRTALAEDSIDRPIALDIPANTRLEDALIEVGTKAGMTVMINTPTVDRQFTQGVHGTLSTRKALAVLLRDSGLSYTQEGERILVVPTAILVRSAFAGSWADSPMPTSSSGADTRPSADSGSPDSGGPGTADRQNNARKDIAEVVVTAQKREERLQDVPVPVTAISADTLVDNNQGRLQDYYASVPGLSLNTTGAGDATLAIRGITTGAYTNSTVAITVDDVPVGTSSALTNNNAFIPDLDPSDLARIEVLRGPQGTLYGASSIGGLVKYVTVDPSTDGVSGRIQADINGVHNGNTAGYGLRAAVNVPVSDTFAMRATGFFRHDPGYIDDPVYHLYGVNRGHAEGGRFSALWKPTDVLSIKLSALLQNSNHEALSVVLQQSGLGDLQQTFLPTSRGPGAHVSRVGVYTANVTAKLGDLDLTSVSGYSTNKAENRFDFSPIYGFYANQFFGVGGTLFTYKTETKKFTQEFRASSSIGQKFDWLLGVFYTHERSPVDGPIEATDLTTGAPVGSLGDYNYSITVAEYAAFADLTVHFTDQFDVQFGGRESSNRQIYDETDTGPIVPVFFGFTSPLVAPTLHTKDNAFTYLVTPRFRVSSDLMVYARLASGYRPGGPNADAALFGYSSHVQPDKTENYEIGAKGTFLDKRVSFDASMFYINWKDIQLLIIDPTTYFGIYTNGSGAKSQGVELSGQAKPFDGLTIGLWAAYTDAKLTSDLPLGGPGSARGFSGDRLPYSSRFSGNLWIEQETHLTAAATGFIRGSIAYVGERESDFSTSAKRPRIPLPGYAQANVLAGVRYESWTLSAFVNNVADRRGVVSRPTYYGPGLAYSYIQPRTAGLSISKTF
jgi:outer membrane receptor protein involved in Fe transport